MLLSYRPNQTNGLKRRQSFERLVLPRTAKTTDTRGLSSETLCAQHEIETVSCRYTWRTRTADEEDDDLDGHGHGLTLRNETFGAIDWKCFRHYKQTRKQFPHDGVMSDKGG